jgi:hypothetical protein
MKSYKRIYPIARQQLADYYGISRKTLYRFLKRFQDKGIDLPTRRLFTPLELERLFSLLGSPFSEDYQNEPLNRR